MPVVPTEQNKVGIAGVTGEKLAAGDFAGSGLQAIGAGLGQLGGAMHELAGAQEAVDDAAVKRAYNAYAAGVRPALYEGAMVDQQGDAALQSVPTAIQQVFDQRDKAAAGLHERLRGQFLQAVAPRIEQDLQWIRDNHATQAKVAQRQQSDGVMANSARDAVSQYGTPGFEDSIATGLKQIDEQAAAGGWTSTAKAAAELGYVSGIHRDVVETLATQDPVLGGGYLRQRSAELTPADRAQAWQALQGPLTQAQAVADLDTLDLQRSPTAPQTPPGDLGLLARRMLAITPPDTGSGTAGTELPALLQRYRGDAAGAWAASRLGADAVDALIARHGDRWFGALPEETRRAVVGDMALLRSATSPRQAPAAADRAALAGTIEDQPWSDVRKRNVYDELNTRIALEDRRRSAAQDAAAAAGFELSDQLKERFLSINQLPPAVRRDLGADALAALTLRAERNLHPVTVAPHGDAMEKLNGMAATDPAGFAKLDLRLYRDQVTPAEYETLGRVQQAWSGYPPAAHGVTQQRSWERVKASGLSVGLANRWNAARGDQPASMAAGTSVSNMLSHVAAQSDDRITFGRGGRPNLGSDGKSLLESMLEPLIRTPDPTKPPPVFAGYPVRLPNGHRIKDDHSDSRLLMSPVADLGDVAAAGRAAGRNYRLVRNNPEALGSEEFNIISAMASNVGQGGKFDYQRKGNHLTGFEQRRQFRNVSNFNVGLFMQQTGLYTLHQTLDISGKFAEKFSSNFRKDQPYGLDPQTARWIRIGYNAGRSGAYGKATAD